jgi:IS605 OrfB family transposase
MRLCAEIFNQHVGWALANNTYNKNKAHKDLYAALRLDYPTVPSALLQAVRDTAMEAVKATKFKLLPRKKPTSALRYDARTITLRGRQVTLSCIGKRVSCSLHVPEYFREVFENWEFKGATLTYTKHKKQFWLRLTFEKQDPPKQDAGDVIGIDRGLYHLAVTSNKQFFSSNKIRATQRRYLHNRKKLQQKGTRNAKRRLKSMSGRKKRFMKDINHCVSKKIANLPGISTYVLEDLTGIRNQRRNKKMNKWMSSWPFYQMEQFLTYKSGALGKEVKYVDARYTSKKCNQCGHINGANRKKSRFVCKCCGYQEHADLNASYNIRDNYILSSTLGTEEQGAVNRPNATDRDIQLQAPSLYGWGG